MCWSIIKWKNVEKWKKIRKLWIWQNKKFAVDSEEADRMTKKDRQGVNKEVSRGDITICMKYELWLV